MTTPTLPAWWPPSGYQEITEAQVRELFVYLKTVMPPAKTVKHLTGRRLGYFDALQVVHLSARTRDETVSVSIGLRADGRLATLEGTPERRQQEWQVWEG